MSLANNLSVTTTTSSSSKPPAARAYRPAPVGERLTRAELVGGLRTVFQRIRLETFATAGGTEPECLLDAAVVLRDVATQFGLTTGEIEDILAEYAQLINGDNGDLR